MNNFYRNLATSFVAASDLHKTTPSLAFKCEVMSKHLLLGRAFGNKAMEVCIATLYACKKGANCFVFFRATDALQGFVVSTKPMSFVTLSELGYAPEHNAAVGITNVSGCLRWSDFVGHGDGTSFWLVEPRWSETLKWISEHVPD